MNEFSDSEIVATDKGVSDSLSVQQNFYYSATTIGEILNKKYYLEYKPTEEESDKFANCANCIAENIENYFEAYKRNTLNERDVDIFCEYIADDITTLRALGEKFNLTRERIRQLLIKYRKKLKGCFYKEEYNTYVNAVYGCLANIRYEEFVHFIAFGFLTQYSKRFTLFVLQCLCDSSIAENVLAVALNLILPRPAVNKGDRRLEEFLAKACFPSENLAEVNIEGLESTENIYRYKFIENFYLRLSRCNKLKAVIYKPKIVYYVTSSTEHIPDFGLLTDDGRFILLVMVPTINMAIHYNLNRFSALHEFCKGNGYGYIVSDDRFNTIYDIKNIEVDKKLSEELFKILNRYGGIGWKDIQGLKRNFEITNGTIAAFIMQNNLKFLLNPFVIMRSDGKVEKNKIEAMPEIRSEDFQPDLPETEETSNRRGAEEISVLNDIEYTVKVGKYDFICDENGEILTNSELFEALRKLRKDLAEAEVVPAFYIFWDSQLIGLATYKPLNEEEWLAIKGLGAGKFKKYGEQVIGIIKKYDNK